MTNESKMVRYTPEVVHKTVGTGISYGVAEMREREHGTFVTHTDHMALEEHRASVEFLLKLEREAHEATKEELAALRGKISSIEKKDTDTCNRGWANGWNSCRLALEALK